MPIHRWLVLCSAAGITGAAARWTWRHRHSPAVAAWAPSRGIDRRAGPLQVRILGSGEPVVLLLHGMLAAGNSFGAAYDPLSEHATVVVPDLLGFGGSMRTTGLTDAAAHIGALDAALAALGLEQRPTVVVGHSMGGCLALRWAAEHPDRVCSVVTFGAPLYLDRAEADEHVAGMGQMEAFLGGDGPVPRAVCAVMCRHRTIASWVAIAYRPDLPVPVARLGVRHTWHTYTGALDGLIRDAGWAKALGVLSHAGIPVTLAVGIADGVPVLGRAEGLAGTWPGVRQMVHPQADHGLPFTDPEWCRWLVADAVTQRAAPGPLS